MRACKGDMLSCPICSSQWISGFASVLSVIEG
ncbi:MAG TPA: hypothetical protein IGS37_00925 [Synechococcales cyanobacterium M55_K2018_004]|nr:hypothetical protein [Synechococcales cyanobacterium M55_K2018_004]